MLLCVVCCVWPSAPQRTAPPIGVDIIIPIVYGNFRGSANYAAADLPARQPERYAGMMLHVWRALHAPMCAAPLLQSAIQLGGYVSSDGWNDATKCGATVSRRPGLVYAGCLETCWLMVEIENELNELNSN